MKIKVSDVANEMDLPGPEFTAYLNPKTGKFVSVSEEEMAALEAEDPDDLPGWMEDILPEIREAVESEDYLALPSSFDIHEWEIMRDFANSVADPEASAHLLRALHGGGAFRRFKDELHRQELLDEWYAHRKQELEKIAMEWLEEHGKDYERDG